jgi:hypothetical protein
MADRDYYCTSIDTPFKPGADCIIEGHDNVAIGSLTYIVTRQISAAVVDGLCPLDEYALALNTLLQIPSERRSDFVFDPLPPAPSKIAELARRAMLDIATDIQFGASMPEDVAVTLLSRTCQEVQEWGLLTRFEVNARLGINGESPRVHRSIAKVREQTGQAYGVLAAQCAGDPRHDSFRTAKVSKLKPSKDGPLATFITGTK